MRIKTGAAIHILLILLYILPVLSSCSGEKEPILIGLSTTLTGNGAPGGIQSRDGVILAFEELNSSGGIDGRMVELIILDDKSSAEEALKVDSELLDKGVIAVLGHRLSNPTLAVVPEFNKRNRLLISLSASTDALSGLDDQFVRVVNPVNVKAPLFAEYLLTSVGLQKMAVVFDMSNAGYTEAMYKHFKSRFEELGGDEVIPVPYDPRDDFEAPEIAGRIIDSEVDGIFLVTNSVQGALISQHVRKLSQEITITTTEWTIGSSEFIKTGGSAVEGILGFNEDIKKSDNKKYLEITESYLERFGTPPGGAAMRSYEAAQVLIAALKKTTDPEKIKSSILDIRTYKTVFDEEFIIDEYGDSVRPMYIHTVKNGELITIDKID